LEKVVCEIVQREGGGTTELRVPSSGDVLVLPDSNLLE